MSNSKELERLWKLQAKINMLVLDGKRSPTAVADALQDILHTPQPEFELYLFGKQKVGQLESGLKIEADLKETGRINRCLSAMSWVVKDWLAHPETYPEEFKDKNVFLWAPININDNGGTISYLYWVCDVVYVNERWIGSNNWRENDPALLVSNW